MPLLCCTLLFANALTRTALKISPRACSGSGVRAGEHLHSTYTPDIQHSERKHIEQAHTASQPTSHSLTHAHTNLSLHRGAWYCAACYTVCLLCISHAHTQTHAHTLSLSHPRTHAHCQHARHSHTATHTHSQPASTSALMHTQHYCCAELH